MRRILVTGAATWTGGRLVQRLEARRNVEVFATDDIEPSLPFGSEFHRAGLDQLRLAKYILRIRPETVVHVQTVDRTALFGRRRAHEQQVLGAQALFGAIGRCEETRHVVVKSDAAFYGAHPRNPSVFRETTRPHGRPTRYQRELAEMEAFVATMAATHDHVDYTVLRIAPIVGANVDNPLCRYLQLRVVPTLLGFDPRMQLIHEEDAVGALEYLVDHPSEGIFNVAAPGQLYLSRILRLGRRIGQPLPRRALRTAVHSLRRLGIAIPDHVVGHLTHGRVMDTTAMTTVIGFQPKHTCRQAVLAMYGKLPERRPPPERVHLEIVR